MSRLIKLVLNLGVIVCLSGVLVACGGGEERQSKYLDRAQEYFDDGNYEKARVDLKNVLQINANNIDARFLMAQLEEKEENWRGTFGNLNAVLELDENHLEATTKMGTLLLASGEIDEAAEKADKAMELAPDSANSIALMASVEVARDNRDNAERLAKRALAIDPGQEEAVAVVVYIYGTDQPEKSLEVLVKALEVNPTSIPLRLTQIRVLNVLGRSDELIAAAEQLIQLDPEENAYIVELAKYYNRAFRAVDAEQLLRESIKARPEDTELKLILVRLLATNKDSDTAKAELEGMLAAEPENYQLRNDLGQLLFGFGATDRAIAVYEATFEFDQDGADSQSARNALAGIALSKKDWTSAQRWIDEALELEQEHPGALINSASMNVAQGNYELAVPDLRRALRSQPDSVRALLLLAEAEKADGKASLALENYRKILAVDPNNVIALYQGALLLAAQEDYAVAATNLEQLVILEPANMQVIVSLVGAYTRLERWDDAQALAKGLSADEATQAVADLISSSLALDQNKLDESITLAKAALEKNENLTGAAVNIAKAYFRNDEISEAISFLEPYLTSHPENGVVADIMVQLYMTNKEPEKAAATYVRLIELVPQRVSAYVNLASIYAYQNKPELVEGLYQQGIAANPDNTALRLLLVQVYQRQGKTKKGLDLLEEAYQLDETSQGVINNLAMTLMDSYPTEENLQRVQKMTRGFESMNNPEVLDTVGWLQYLLGNSQQAISLLEAAQKNGGQGPEYWYHLGMAYHKNGQLELAREQLIMALENPAAQFSGRDEAQRVNDSL